MPDKQLVKTAKNLLKAGKYEQAAELFEKAGDMEGAIETHLLLKNYTRAGEIAISIGQGVKAVEFYKKSGRFDLVAEYYFARKEYLEAGHFYTRSGQHIRAAEVYDLLVRKYPELNDIPGQTDERTEEEVKLFRLAASAHSRAGNYLRAARLYHRINAFDEEAKNLVAAKDYNSAAEALKRNNMFSNAGQIYAEGRNFLNAAECFEKDSAYRLAAENYSLAGHHSKAGELFSRAGDPFAASAAYRMAGEIDTAIKTLAAIPLDSNEAMNALEAIIELSYQKEYLNPSAKRFIDGMIQKSPDPLHIDLYLNAGRLLEMSEYQDHADHLFARLRELNPELVDAFLKSQNGQSGDVIEAQHISNILDEDFEATEREKEYQKRLELLDSVRKTADETDGTMAVNTAAIGSDGSPRVLPPSFMHIQEGQKFGERYLIVKHIGAGGMGTVYQARDLELDETVAIKILSPQLNLDENAVARFKQEIKLARQINHQNVIRIYDLGEIYGIRFISMEYFPGEQIKKILMEQGSFNIPAGLELILKVCDGIIAAHKKGIIHRDIKSQNILMSTDGIVKILDFGIAKSTEIPSLTMDGSILGTPEYISPEAILQKPVDMRSDIYSLGIVMFEIFTGAVPYQGDTIMSVIRQHLYDDPPVPSSQNTLIPTELDDVILQCLEKEPNNRFQSVAALTSELKILNLAYGGNGLMFSDTTRLD